jgi:PKD repeat protein
MTSLLNGTRSSLLASQGCVSPLAGPPVTSFQVSATSICKNDQVTFTDLSTNTPSSWSWSFPGGIPNSSTSKNPTITYSTTGTHNVTLTATNSLGSDVETLNGFITVKSLPQYSVQTTNSQTFFCAGSSLTLEAVSSTNNLTYQWSRYSVNLSGATNATYDATRTGNYKVTVTKINGCSKLSSPNKITKLPYPALSLSASGPTDICPGDSVTLTATNDPSYSYSWKKYGNVIQGINGNTYNAKTAGKYKVIITNSNGCQRSSPKITVNISCRQRSVNKLDNKLMLFPNPVLEGILFVKFISPPDDNVRIRIVSALGIQTFTAIYPSMANQKIPIDVSHYNNGAYVVIMESQSGSIQKRFIIQ